MEVIIFGSSGMIGGFLTHYCLANEAVSKVRTFGRKSLSISHPKLEQFICEFDTLGSVADKIQGDIVFNCLGTTRKDAGSDEKQYEIDCQYPLAIARLAAQNGIQTMINVSSVGASDKGNFYLKTKFDMEEGVAQSIKKHVYFLRPSLLMGDRKKLRIGERISQWIMPAFSFLLQGSLEKYRPIQACDLAKAMLGLAFVLPKAPTILHYRDILKYARQISATD